MIVVFGLCIIVMLAIAVYETGQSRGPVIQPVSPLVVLAFITSAIGIAITAGGMGWLG